MVNSSNKDFFIPLPLFTFKALRCAPQNIFTGMKMKKNMNVLYFLPYPQRNECMILKSQIITPWRCHENNSKFKSLIRSHKIRAQELLIKDVEIGRKQRTKGDWKSYNVRMPSARLDHFSPLENWMLHFSNVPWVFKMSWKKALTAFLSSH